MIEYLTLIVSASAMIVGITQALLLARGAPRREAVAWLGVAAVLAAGAVQRMNLGIRAMQGDGIGLPVSVNVTVMVMPIVVTFVLWRIRPILEGYRAADRAREASDERFRRALAESRDPIAIVNAEGFYTYVNDAGCAFFRYPREQILGRHAREFLLEPDGDDPSSLRRAFATGAAHIERDVIRRDGSTVPVECDLIALGDGSLLIVGRDLTPRREAELQRVRVQRLEAVSTLAAGVAHDFNNLLSVIGVSLELAADRRDIPLDGAIRATERASVLTRELIEFSRAAVERAARPEPSAIDIGPVVRESARLVAAGLDHRIAIDVQQGADAIQVRAYPADVDRICMNLLVNARDAVTEQLDDSAQNSGRIQIAVRLAPPAANARESQAEIVVRDSGTGISDAVRHQLFEPFVSTKDGAGHGLGLAATRELVANLGGTIEVDSQPGTGTTFTVCLPIARDSQPAQNEAAALA